MTATMLEIAALIICAGVFAVMLRKGLQCMGVEHLRAKADEIRHVLARQRQERDGARLN